MALAKSDQGWMSGSVSDDILTVGDPRLKRPTTLIPNPQDVDQLLERMTSRIRQLNGAGLAAPQIGIPVKAIVVEVRKTDVFPERPASPLIQMINPIIMDRTSETERRPGSPWRRTTAATSHG